MLTSDLSAGRRDVDTLASTQTFNLHVSLATVMWVGHGQGCGFAFGATMVRDVDSHSEPPRDETQRHSSLTARPQSHSSVERRPLAPSFPLDLNMLRETDSKEATWAFSW